jgi:hypothetical protein
MNTSTLYEWGRESVIEYGDGIDDILDTYHATRLRDVENHEDMMSCDGATTTRLVLIRDVFEGDGDLADRQWAYIIAGVLPEEFDGGARIPQRFRKELENQPTNQLKP